MRSQTHVIGLERPSRRLHWSGTLTFVLLAGVVAAAGVLFAAGRAVANPSAGARAQQQWKAHDMNRPQPGIITPGEASTQDRAGQPPSDAIVLFGGKDISAWRSLGGGPAKWRVQDGYFEVVPKTGNIQTKQGFGDCQLHVEWAPPAPPHGESQGRGNSGVYLMSLYEIQVLDSYQNETYPDGQAAAVYGEYPPLVNAMRPPGQWQTYDIVFRRPRFDTDGKLLRPAYATVLHNGVLVQDHVALTGPTDKLEPFHVHPDKLPLMFQDHGQPVRFRNIWIRELTEEGL